MSSKLVASGNHNLLVDWNNLPLEVWGSILDKLLPLSDFIRFGAVCKSWHSLITNQRKEERISTIHKQPPMLLIATEKKQGRWNMHTLYNMSEGKIYNCQLQVWDDWYNCLGSAYGWLILRILGYGIRLYNPFTRNRVRMPKMKNCWAINKVALSCDPSTCPNDLVVAVSYCNYSYYQVAIFRVGENSWTYIDALVEDVIFHKGLLWAVDSQNQLIAIDCMKPVAMPLVVVQIEPRFPSNDSRNFYESCLLEASNGDLLLVKTFSGLASTNWLPFCRTPHPAEYYQVYKLVGKKVTIQQSSSSSDFEWVEVDQWGKNDAIFKVGSESSSVSVDCSPNCNHSSIYAQVKAHISITSWWGEGRIVLETNQLKRTKRSMLGGIGGSNLRILPAWLSPTKEMYAFIGKAYD